MIKDEQLWLEALVARNNVAHAYNEEIALDIIRKTKKNFLLMFDELKREMELNWN